MGIFASKEEDADRPLELAVGSVPSTVAAHHEILTPGQQRPTVDALTAGEAGADRAVRPGESVREITVLRKVIGRVVARLFEYFAPTCYNNLRNSSRLP